MKFAWLRSKNSDESPTPIHSTADATPEMDATPETYGDERFLSPWKFRIRFTEEVTRSTRYERPLSLVTMLVEDGDPSMIEVWLRNSTRALDAICRDTDNHYYVLLPESDVESASGLAKRLLKNFRGISVTVTGIPADETRFTEIADSITAMDTRAAA